MVGSTFLTLGWDADAPIPHLEPPRGGIRANTCLEMCPHLSLVLTSPATNVKLCYIKAAFPKLH